MRSVMPLLLDWQQYLPFRHHAPREVHDTLRLANGTPVMLRASRPDDAERIQEFVHGLSVKSRYQRFFSPIHELAPEMLARFIRNDAHEAMTLLALVQGDGGEIVIAMGQYVCDPFPDRCDFAVVVGDNWQRSGLGRKMTKALMCIARAAGMERFEGDILAENEPMRRLMLELGFRFGKHPDGPYLHRVSKRLRQSSEQCSPLVALASNSDRRQAHA
ncbi:MAG TPA: GNAT family N-acetyltransferase [Noviherbaspirillum sp.]|nr:GNAT family N-acetyltransferase [Noviherbaspirillum sp.]